MNGIITVIYFLIRSLTLIFSFSLPPVPGDMPTAMKYIQMNGGVTAEELYLVWHGERDRPDSDRQKETQTQDGQIDIYR